MFLVNLLLALAWAALTGNFTPANIIGGFVLGYAMLWISRRTESGRMDPYFGKLTRTLRFFGFFLRELLIANMRVTRYVVGPTSRLRPGIVAIPLDITSDKEITMLANLITLTPGTLSLDVSDDRKVLYVHSIQVTDPDVFRQEIKQGFERRVKEFFE